MNWRLIAQLSLFGLAMGIATVFFIPSTIEPLFWLVIFGISASSGRLGTQPFRRAEVAALRRRLTSHSANGVRLSAHCVASAPGCAPAGDRRG
jgi:hypothetical protein